MRNIIWQLFIVLFTPSAFASETDSSASFELLGLHIGQQISEAREEYPAMECKSSCVVEGQKAFDKPGLLWIGMEKDKISQLAFGFKPDLSLEEGAKIRSAYVKKYGPPADPLGTKGCEEWVANGGFLAICFTGNTSPSGDISHIWWSTQSRVDINIQNQRKQK